MRHDFHWMRCFSAAECQSTWNDERQLCTNELKLPVPFSTQITGIAVQVYITLDPGIDQTQLHGNFTWCYNDEFDEVEDARDVSPLCQNWAPLHCSLQKMPSGPYLL